MNKCTIVAHVIVVTSLVMSELAMAQHPRLPKKGVTIETCILAAQAERAGKMVKLDVKLEKTRPVYEFDIERSDGTVWDVECDARTGKITEIEREVKNANDPLFKAKSKISLEQAKRIVLKAYPGTINDAEVEFEIEENGNASYEMDVLTKNGKEMKIEVDATTGKIVEANEELYQIGRE
jgi:uncharacterized membrane protein YkoI